MHNQFVKKLILLAVSSLMLSTGLAQPNPGFGPLKNPYGIGPKGAAKPKNSQCTKPPQQGLIVRTPDINDLHLGLKSALTESNTDELLHINAAPINWLFSLIVDLYQGLSEAERSKKIKEIIQQLPEPLQKRLKAIGNWLSLIECRTAILEYFDEDEEVIPGAEIEAHPLGNSTTNTTPLETPHLTFAAQFPPTNAEIKIMIHGNRGCN